MNKIRSANEIQKDWDTNPRWKNVKRDYTAEEVVRCSGSVRIEHSLAKNGAEKLWDLINKEDFVNALGALTGNQAMQQAKAGLKAVYLSGWQVAGDANSSGQMYPDQSLYPVDSVPAVIRRINNSLRRADQLNVAEGNDVIDYMLPIVADAEAGFGGVLNAFELMKAMIEAGAAGVHFEDQLASAKKMWSYGRKSSCANTRSCSKISCCKIGSRCFRNINSSFS
jgi:isocitrate lyase